MREQRVQYIIVLWIACVLPSRKLMKQKKNVNLIRIEDFVNYFIGWDSTVLYDFQAIIITCNVYIYI